MNTVREQTPLVRAAKDGDRRWFAGGGVHTWKLTEGETGGALLLFEMTIDGGKVTPLHVHPDSDETMYVLEGEILMHLDGSDHTVRTGGTAFAPRGLPTPSRSCPTRPGSSACTLRVAARPSTSMPAIRWARTALRQGPSTSIASATPRNDMGESSWWVPAVRLTPIGARRT